MPLSPAPENRALTAAVCKRLGIWPLDPKHRPGRQCLCAECFGDRETAFSQPTTVPPGELAHLRTRRRRKAFAWEEDAA